MQHWGPTCVQHHQGKNSPELAARTDVQETAGPGAEPWSHVQMDISRVHQRAFVRAQTPTVVASGGARAAHSPPVLGH